MTASKNLFMDIWLTSHNSKYLENEATSRRSLLSTNVISVTKNTAISCVNEMRYLGIFIVRSRKFKCSLEYDIKSFYRAANAVFSETGRVASEEVTLQLIKSKSLPVLLYGLEACFLTKSDLQSIDFVINMLFTAKSNETVKYCQEYFDFSLPSV